MTYDYRRMIDCARQLVPAECERHARVSSGPGGCDCRDCFTCACAHVMWVREQTANYWRKVNNERNKQLEAML